MGKIIILASATLFLLLMLGCSSHPSDKDAKSVAINLIAKNNSTHFIKLISFYKTNGIEGELTGQKIYKIEFVAETEVINECYYIDGFHASSPQDDFLSNLSFMKTKEIGYRVKFDGVMQFEKTDNGWRGIDGNIY